ncbi:MAG: hypothetical protein DHS20C18_02420 [Saprospiraceae bacterium]|nr:MAG: hypothetical protein DHS20C18_02420 [Saprospiraceae bacterium]
MTDTQINDAILKGGKAEKDAIAYIYQDEDYRTNTQIIARNHRRLRLTEWMDVFNESIIQLVKSLKKGNYKGDRPLLDYFKGICRNICAEFYRKENRDQQRLDPRDIPMEDLRTPYLIAVEEDFKAIMRKAFAELSEMCRQILTLRMKGISMREIAKILGLSNERTAITYAARCRNRLRDILEKTPFFNQR